MKTRGILLPLQKIWQQVVTWLVNSSELQVWQVKNRRGHVCWHAYDPHTGKSACFGTEEEVRMWIEQRYYCR